MKLNIMKIMKITTCETFRRLSKIEELIKNEYYLHPRAFKMCLMRSLKTKYAKYYLLLEECIKYYNDYGFLRNPDELF